MNIRQLELFLAICQHGSMSEAVKHVYISQPALSKAIRELEASIGVSLFDRVHGQLRLNEYGENFRQKATKLVYEFRELENFNQELDEIPLRIGVSLTLAKQTLPQAIQLFQEKYPQKKIKIYAENVDQIQRRLERYEIDMAFTESFRENEAFQLQKISTYRLLLVASAQLNVSHLTSQACTNIAFLLREKGSTLRDGLDNFLESQGIQVVPFMESVNTEVLIQAALSGLGITILPEPFASSYLQSGELVEVTLAGAQFQTINYVVTRHGEEKTSYQNDFLTCFTQIEQSALEL
ncbi:LysR family transcriptional regulator [Enterococcus saccharolyticus]|uniref:LysR family transcriptional regulator n=1 Tax=Enterococcus saccharolyticus TaxID=41997 RepID=UPI001E62ADC5|nr:LysR family transcriptional regulator [Enterococcus saccharolyticus]MCD5000903.1 LysR family transcriptional regulator [Enterococcus saccharolyticus]